MLYENGASDCWDINKPAEVMDKNNFFFSLFCAIDYKTLFYSCWELTTYMSSFSIYLLHNIVLYGDTLFLEYYSHDMIFKYTGCPKKV